MTEETFRTIMKGIPESIRYTCADSIFVGLNLIAKYLPGWTLITGAEHEIIYSVPIFNLVDAGITKEDVIVLRDMLWHVDSEYFCLAKFV